MLKRGLISLLLLGSVSSAFAVDAHVFEGVSDKGETCVFSYSEGLGENIVSLAIQYPGIKGFNQVTEISADDFMSLFKTGEAYTSSQTSGQYHTYVDSDGFLRVALDSDEGKVETEFVLNSRMEVVAAKTWNNKKSRTCQF